MSQMRYLSLYSAVRLSEAVLNQTINSSGGQYSLCVQKSDKCHYFAIFLVFMCKILGSVYNVNKINVCERRYHIIVLNGIH